MRLARPLYESLPATYTVIGALAVLIAYIDPEGLASVVAFAIGLCAAVAALTIHLHRQDYRERCREYSGAPAAFESAPEVARTGAPRKTF